MESWRGNTFKAVCPFFKKKRWIYRHQPTICQWKWCWLSSIWSDEKITFFPYSYETKIFCIGWFCSIGTTRSRYQSLYQLAYRKTRSRGFRTSLKNFLFQEEYVPLVTAKGIEAEVLNAGMIAQDSGGVRRIAMEVLQYKPTGLILYLGNNEGIGMALECKENNSHGTRDSRPLSVLENISSHF